MQKISKQASAEPPGAALYERYASLIFTYLFRRLPTREDAEDLLVEVFLAACQEERLFAMSADQQLAWLQRVAHNKAIDSYRREMRSPLLPLEMALNVIDDYLTPEQHVVQREGYQRLYQMLEQLPPVQQRVLQLRYGQGLRFKEIAELMNKSEATVRNQVMRTLRQLRKLYEQR